MKVDISIEFDKELATAIMDTVREISKGIKSLQGIFDKSDWSVTTESVIEPKPKQTRPVIKRKPRAKKTLRGTVLKIIKQNKEGISRKALQEETGFSTKQISNCVFQLKKNQTIQMTEDGLLKVL
ncbi:MAG: hypothetical protein LC657_01315 [Desulfobacteraceae bacterium]|nr:hypothetical protein [Desulfobacteraceae bacterium]